MPSTRGSLQIDTLSLEALNFVLSQIQDQLDELKGLRGTVAIKHTVESNSGFKHVDANGTTIHSFGPV